MPKQLKAARALAGWSRDQLAEKASVAAETIKRFEIKGSDPKLSTLNKWRRTLEAAGIQFIDEDADGGPGVRLVRGAKGKR